jgi:hypothetical protein
MPFNPRDYSFGPQRMKDVGPLAPEQKSIVSADFVELEKRILLHLQQENTNDPQA